MDMLQNYHVDRLEVQTVEIREVQIRLRMKKVVQEEMVIIVLHRDDRVVDLVGLQVVGRRSCILVVGWISILRDGKVQTMGEIAFLWYLSLLASQLC